MGKHPDLSRIEQYLKIGKPFHLSRTQYISLTGVDVPQKPKYTAQQSAIAKKAKEHGFSIKVIPEVLIFEKE